MFFFSIPSSVVIVSYKVPRAAETWPWPLNVLKYTGNNAC